MLKPPGPLADRARAIVLGAHLPNVSNQWTVKPAGAGWNATCNSILGDAVRNY